MKLKDSKNETIDINKIEIITEIPEEYIKTENIDDFWL